MQPLLLQIKYTKYYIHRTLLLKINSPSSAYSPADEILKYKNLLDIGAITEEEYNQKKQELLQK